MRSRPLASCTFFLFASLAAFTLSIAGLGCASTAPPAPTCPTPAATSAPSATSGDDLSPLTDEQLATKLLELTGATHMGKQVMDGMTDSFGKLPGLPPGFLERFRQNAHTEELTALLVPIYVKNFDRPTLMAAIEFYQSRYGRILVAALPAATKASMEVGQTWGRKVAEQTLTDMGITPPKSP
jgi:hypothetical protein